jgi:hypothetical protein
VYCYLVGPAAWHTRVPEVCWLCQPASAAFASCLSCQPRVQRVCLDVCRDLADGIKCLLQAVIVDVFKLNIYFALALASYRLGCIITGVQRGCDVDVDTIIRTWLFPHYGH